MNNLADNDINKLISDLDKMYITTDFDDKQFKLILPRVTKTDYEYDDKGRVSKSYSDMYGMNIVTEFKYDDNGNLIYYSTINNGNVNTKTETIKQYDDQNRIISSLSSRYIESYQYTDEGYFKSTKDIEAETETTEIFKVDGDKVSLVSMERYSIPKDYIDRKITTEYGDNWYKISNYEDDILVHSETIDTIHKRPIIFEDRMINNPDDSIGFIYKTEFTYDEDGDIIKIKNYENDNLVNEENNLVTLDGETKEIDSSTVRLVIHKKNGYKIYEYFYKDESDDLSYKMTINSEDDDNDIMLEKSIIKSNNGNNFEVIRVSSGEYSIDMVNLKLVDIYINIDRKLYEFGSDLHGTSGVYAAVTTYTENDKINEYTKVEYNRNTVNDPLTDYLSSKVFKFITNNNKFKDILDLAEVNYEELNR